MAVARSAADGYTLLMHSVAYSVNPSLYSKAGYEVGKDARKKIEVLSVRTEGDTTCANVFVPEGRLTRFEKYVEDLERISGDLMAVHRDSLIQNAPKPQAKKKGKKK